MSRAWGVAESGKGLERGGNISIYGNDSIDDNYGAGLDGGVVSGISVFQGSD
jgi:hypothetical protein